MSWSLGRQVQTPGVSVMVLQRRIDKLNDEHGSIEESMDELSEETEQLERGLDWINEDPVLRTHPDRMTRGKFSKLLINQIKTNSDYKRLRLKYPVDGRDGTEVINEELLQLRMFQFLLDLCRTDPNITVRGLNYSVDENKNEIDRAELELQHIDDQIAIWRHMIDQINAAHAH